MTDRPDLTTLIGLRQMSPQFVSICEAIVLQRWRKFSDSYIPNDYQPDSGRSVSYPLLRPADVDYMTDWDGLCFRDAFDSRISEMVLELIGEEVKRASGLTLAWNTVRILDGDNSRWQRALLIVAGKRPASIPIDPPALIEP